jgi:hypothetical protein
VGGARRAALQQCAQKLNLTLGSKAAVLQLSAAQRAALKQCVRANLQPGTI